MKKALLFATAAAMAASAATAEVFPAAKPIEGTDITPAAYNFNTYDKEFIGFKSVDSDNWNMKIHWIANNVISGNIPFGDGLIPLAGPNYSGLQDEKVANVAQMNAATKIVDCGGSLGKCLIINTPGSDFPAKYKELTGADLEIGESGTGFAIPFWIFDPVTTVKFAGSDMNLRVRIEMNYYSSNMSSTESVMQPYVNDDENNVRPAGKEDNTAPDRAITINEFAYRWCDKDETSPEDDSIWDEEVETGVWNPNRFLVYEWDINVAPQGGDEAVWNYCPRIKMEMPGTGFSANGTYIIRSVQLYAPSDANRELYVKKRLRTWNTYTWGTPAGVAGIEADDNAPVEYFNLQGVRVANPENGLFIRRQGSKVSKHFVK